MKKIIKCNLYEIKIHNISGSKVGQVQYVWIINTWIISQGKCIVIILENRYK